MKDLTILFDMDGVFADSIDGFNRMWQKLFPGVPFIPYEKITEFYIENLYPVEQNEMVKKVWGTEGLFYNLKPIPGAFEAMEEIRRKVRDVAICTCPCESKYCKPEKEMWVRDHLGNFWVDRLMIETDKTKVLGDILIDDKPRITGSRTPSWEHVLYTHPWNKNVVGKRRLTWDNWREVLTELN